MKYHILVLLSWVLLFLLCPRRAPASEPLDAIIVMDNSETVVQSDRNYWSVAAAGLFIELLRPEDRLYLVSCGAGSSVVLSSRGDEKQKFITSIGMMKRESSANDFVEVLRTLKEHVDILRKGEKNKKKKRKKLVVWFMSSEIRLNVKNKEYRTTGKAINLWAKAKKSGLGKNPFKKKAVREYHKEIFDLAVEQSLQYADELRKMGIALNVFVMGKTLSAPGLTGDAVDKPMEEIVKRTGGSLTFMGGEYANFILDNIISIFVEKISAPTITITNEDSNHKGVKFEVYRKSENLWVVVLFKTNPPKNMSMVSIDYTNNKIKKWPFGKRSEDVIYTKPGLEKGHIFKQRRWYKPPLNPVGYGLYVVRKPVEGNYRIKAAFPRGEEYLIRIFQDIDLEFGFLTQPAASIPIGKVFSAVAGLKGPEGGSFTFHRSFLNALEFSVEMEKEGGSVPAWGESKQAQFSKEGEVLMSFEPASPGIYYIKGEVIHKTGEFRALLSPLRVEVYHRVTIEFIEDNLSWSDPARDSWFKLDPGIQLKPEVNIPGDIVFEMVVDWSKVSNYDKLMVSPKNSLKVTHDKKTYPFVIKYKAPASLRFDGETFEGPLYITVKEFQKRNVDGTGSWVINVKGRATPWTLLMYWNEYLLWVNLLFFLLIGVILVIERKIRPSFNKKVDLNITRKFGTPTDTGATINTASIRKPILPFIRQKIVVGVDGSINNRHAFKACRIVPNGKSFTIQPIKYPIRFRQGDISFAAQTRFFGKLEERYLFGDHESEVEFWFTGGP